MNIGVNYLISIRRLVMGRRRVYKKGDHVRVHAPAHELNEIGIHDDGTIAWLLNSSQKVVREVSDKKLYLEHDTYDVWVYDSMVYGVV